MDEGRGRGLGFLVFALRFTYDGGFTASEDHGGINDSLSPTESKLDLVCNVIRGSTPDTWCQENQRCGDQKRER